MEEGQDVSFTITVDPVQTDDLELNVVIRAKGKFTSFPTEPEEYIFVNPEKIKMVTITAGNTEAELVIPTNNDGVDEEKRINQSRAANRQRPYR